VLEVVAVGGTVELVFSRRLLSVNILCLGCLG
jgi:hypothetical protein